MNTSGEVADLMVKEGLQITEEVAKLTGLGAKNLAAIIIAVPSQQKWTQKSFKKRNESYSFFCFRKTAAFIPRFA